ncbi:MAG: hypothetical protein LBK56_12200 [Gracilibacteraceae bacterium]|jgi:hypothetical protein|nr:hypothetical protein [Gracilibacteraceae bacterium]
MIFTKYKKISVEWFNMLAGNIFSKLPDEYAIFLDQIRDGLVSAVYKPGFASTYKPNYIGVGFNPDIAKKYDALKDREPADIDKYELSRGFCLSGIEIYNQKEKRYVEIELSFCDGLFCGIDSAEKLNMFAYDNENIVINNLARRTKS